VAVPPCTFVPLVAAEDDDDDDDEHAVMSKAAIATPAATVVTLFVRPTWNPPSDELPAGTGDVARTLPNCNETCLTSPGGLFSDATAGSGSHPGVSAAIRGHPGLTGTLP
jgi:hypothetical protein